MARSSTKADRRAKARSVDPADYGADERLAKGRVEQRIELDPDGMQLVRHSRELYECELDRLDGTGALREPLEKIEVARRRYDAGVWLRTLFLVKAGFSPPGAQSYAPRSSSSEDLSINMSDDQAWNRRAYNDTIRDMGECGPVLIRVCCYNERVASANLPDLRRALLKLADWRGL